MAHLTAERVELENALAAMEYILEQGWSEGLPAIPPTPTRVQRFLDSLGLPPETIVAEYAPRSRRLTAEKMVINAIMAGCKPEYLPVVLTACRAVTTKLFALNHMATLGSAFPLFIISGPQVNALGFNSGQYLFGPGNRPNATVGRAMSLILANCFDARVGGIQRGNMGHCGRYGPCIAESDETSWPTLAEERGVARGVNAVTAFPSGNPPVQFGVGQTLAAEQAAEIMTRMVTYWRPNITYFLYVVSPAWQEFFDKDGWSKDDVRRYIVEHAKVSIADLKRLGRWQYFGTADGRLCRVEPGDESRMISVLKRDEFQTDLWQEAEIDRDVELLIMVGGGDAGSNGSFMPAYNVGTRPVTVPVKPVAAGAGSGAVER